MKWINIKDNPPKENGLILVTDGIHLGYDYFDSYKMKMYPDDFLEGHISGIPDYTSDSMIGKNVTHWMPMPNPVDSYEKYQ